jgi:hypothetical protein
LWPVAHTCILVTQAILNTQVAEEHATRQDAEVAKQKLLVAEQKVERQEAELKELKEELLCMQGMYSQLRRTWDRVESNELEAARGLATSLHDSLAEAELALRKVGDFLHASSRQWLNATVWGRGFVLQLTKVRGPCVTAVALHPCICLGNLMHTNINR